MKNLIIFIIFLTLISFKNEQSQKLNGLVVVIDPGHGGTDPGASGYFGKDKLCVAESAYCYDVALRLEKLLKSEGAIVFKTVKGTQSKPLNNNPQQVIPFMKGYSLFNLDNSIVEAGSLGLSKRVSFANLKLENYPKHKVVFISIHFDVINKKLLGARIIMGKNANYLGSCLKKELETGHRLTTSDNGLLKNGDKSFGIKNLVVLGKTNKISECALIELGNFKNETDLWRIRDPKVREDYALIVTKSLERFMKK